MRILGSLIEWLIIFAIVRSVIGAVMRLFGPSTHTAAGPARGPQSSSELKSAGEFRKDPVCQTYFAVPSQWAKLVNGETVYFCSKECKERFRV